MTGRSDRIEALRRGRPRSALLRGSAAIGLVGVCAAWWIGDFALADLLSERRQQNVARFAGELVPFALRGGDVGPADWLRWASGQMLAGGWTAVAQSFAISVVAIVLAVLGALVLCFPAASSLATPEPLLPDSADAGPVRRVFWKAVLVGTRLALLGMRAIPEYVWAFLLLGVLGISPWPAVLALAIHNAGILGKLMAESVEDLPAAPAAALRAAGATRRQIALFAALPESLGRFLLYFFYRWETCVRESTVIGMLGIASIGFAVNEARIRLQYDVMVFFVLVGSALVLLGDAASGLARRAIRESE